MGAVEVPEDDGTADADEIDRVDGAGDVTEAIDVAESTEAEAEKTGRGKTLRLFVSAEASRPHGVKRPEPDTKPTKPTKH